MKIKLENVVYKIDEQNILHVGVIDKKTQTVALLDGRTLPKTHFLPLAKTKDNKSWFVAKLGVKEPYYVGFDLGTDVHFVSKEILAAGQKNLQEKINQKLKEDKAAKSQEDFKFYIEELFGR